jgi:hypothetical protein
MRWDDWTVCVATIGGPLVLRDLEVQAGHTHGASSTDSQNGLEAGDDGEG